MSPQSHVDIATNWDTSKQRDQRNKGKMFYAQAHFASKPNEDEHTSSIQTNMIQMERLWYFDTKVTTILPIVENG